MENALWILQWALSVLGVGAYCVLLVYCFKEYRALGIAFLLFPPALLAFYAPTRWSKCRFPFLLFVASLIGAMILQRLRLGYWAWPDVERAG